MEAKPVRLRRWNTPLLALGIVLILLIIAGALVVSGDGPGLFLPVIVQNYKTCGTVPQLTSPKANATVESLTPTFEGSAGPDYNGRYVFIQISVDPDFKQIVRTVSAEGKSGAFRGQVVGNLVPATTYYWRARLVCTGITTSFTPANTFTTPATGVLPAAPVLTNPADAAGSVTRPVMLQWKAVDGATGYLVYYRAAGPHGWYIVSTSQTQLSRTLLPSAAYEWYVVAHNDFGYGPETAHQTFTTAS